MKIAPPKVRVNKVRNKRPLRRKVLRSESSSGRDRERMPWIWRSSQPGVGGFDWL